MQNFQAGTYINQGYYKSFEPDPINKEWQIDNMQVIQSMLSLQMQIGKDNPTVFVGFNAIA